MMSEKLVNDVKYLKEWSVVLKGKGTIVNDFSFEIFLRLKRKLGRVPTKEELEEEIKRVYQRKRYS